MTGPAPEADDTRAWRMLSSYDRIAPVFARTNATMPPQIVEMAERFLARIGLGARVLDLGCGTGRDTAWLAERGAWVVGVDLSNGMLAQARRLGCQDLARMDMRWLGLASGAFDGVWWSASLLHVPKVEAAGALAETRRVLRSGGALFLSLQEGDGEEWETDSAYGPAERFFARYRAEDVAARLDEGSFRVWDWRTVDAGPRRWLQFLAIAV